MYYIYAGSVHTECDVYLVKLTHIIGYYKIKSTVISMGYIVQYVLSMTT